MPATPFVVADYDHRTDMADLRAGLIQRGVFPERRRVCRDGRGARTSRLPRHSVGRGTPDSHRDAVLE
jgi:hypothetical protein